MHTDLWFAGLEPDFAAPVQSIEEARALHAPSGLVVHPQPADAVRVREQAYEYQPCYKAGDVRRVRDPSRVYVADRCETVDQLQEKPQPDEDPRRNSCQPEEKAERDQCPHMAPRIQREVTGEDAGNRTAGAEAGCVRSHRGCDL